MKNERLLRIMGLIDESLIEEAEEKVLGRQHPGWQRWAAMVVAFALLIGAGTYGILHSFFLENGTGGVGAGGAGHVEGSSFMSYAGPVFPLTLAEQQVSVSARRSLIYDFQTYENSGFEDIHVSDGYTLTNEAGEAITMTALYPFAAGFSDLPVLSPSIFVDGREVETRLYPGSYTGGFSGVSGAENDGESGSLNLDLPRSWEDYQALLSSGAYQQAALTEVPPLSQQVIVYEFSDYMAPLETYQAATQAISFTIQADRTKIFTYGFEGGAWNHETGFRRYSYFVPDHISMRSETKRLIVLGEDIGEYTLQGYRDGSCDPEKEIDGVSSRITRYETTLAEAVRPLIRHHLENYQTELFRGQEETFHGASFDLYERAVAEQLYQYGLLSDQVKGRYSHGRLDDLIGESLSLPRVFYLAFDVTLPAGASVDMVAEMKKEPSFDFYCTGSESLGVRGYDLVTGLGSNLTFEAVTAEILNGEQIEIVRQNFGFDPANQVTKVTLDPNEAHYYLEVKRIEEK